MVRGAARENPPQQPPSAARRVNASFALPESTRWEAGGVARVNRSAGQPYTVLWSAAAKRAIGKELPEAVAASALELILGALR